MTAPATNLPTKPCQHIPRDGKPDGLGLIHVECRVCGKLLGYRLGKPVKVKAKR